MVSLTARHALRALVELARIEAGKAMLGKDLANISGIPSNYLSKIMWTLGSAGLIDATRGSGGGYRLARPASQIRLIEVIDLFDKARVKTACLLSDERPCSDSDPCSAHQAWHEVSAAYVQFLECTTLADIAYHEPVSGTVEGNSQEVGLK